MQFGLVCTVCFFPYIFLSTGPKLDFNGLIVKQSNLRLHYSVLVQLKHSILPYLGNIENLLCFLKTTETFSSAMNNFISLSCECQMFRLCLSLVKLFTFLILNGLFFKIYALDYKGVAYRTLLFLCCFFPLNFTLEIMI